VVQVGHRNGRAEKILDSFVETVSALFIEQHQRDAAELELTLQQAQVLTILRRTPVTTGQLAEELGISAPAITQLTDRLVRKGLIERRVPEDDRRCVVVGLSAKGERLVDEFCRRRREVLAGALSGLGESEQGEVFEALGKVVGLLVASRNGTTARAGVLSKSVAKK
jgi:DNA-binding MarR family transcriptional regulator